MDGNIKRWVSDTSAKRIFSEIKRIIEDPDEKNQSAEIDKLVKATFGLGDIFEAYKSGLKQFGLLLSESDRLLITKEGQRRFFESVTAAQSLDELLNTKSFPERKNLSLSVTPTEEKYAESVEEKGYKPLTVSLDDIHEIEGVIKKAMESKYYQTAQNPKPWEIYEWHALVPCEKGESETTGNTEQSDGSVLEHVFVRPIEDGEQPNLALS